MGCNGVQGPCAGCVCGGGWLLVLGQLLLLLFLLLLPPPLVKGERSSFLHLLPSLLYGGEVGVGGGGGGGVMGEGDG